MNKVLKLWLLGVMALTAVSAYKLNAQEVSVRTNLLLDGAAEPNLGIELQTGAHWSVGAEGGLKAWPRWLAWDWDSGNTTHWRNFAISPEARYYFKEVYKGAFVAGGAFYTHYNIGNVQFPLGLYPEVKEERLQGSYWAGVVSFGYSWWAWQHWRLELVAGVAGGLAAYDRFDCATCGTRLGEVRKAAVVPKLALNVAYNPVSRNKHDLRKNEKTGPAETLTVMTPPVAFVVHLRDVKAPETLPDKLARENSWVMPISEYRPLNYQTRPGIDSLLCVNFEMDSEALMRGLRQNGEVLDKLQQTIEAIRDAGTTDELLVSIVGLASIEGSQRYNDTLSVRRARAVAHYLNNRTRIGRAHFDISGKGEAWDWFRDQLNAAPEGMEKLIDIVNNEPDADVREQKIKADPALYALVKERFLSDQRNSGYIRIYYSNLPDAVTEKWNGPVMTLLKKRQYKEAVAYVQADEALYARVTEDPEAANAYGVALYFTALDEEDPVKEQEAVAILEKAARNGSVAAPMNLKGIETYGVARHEYDAWRKIMNEQ